MEYTTTQTTKLLLKKAEKLTKGSFGYLNTYSGTFFTVPEGRKIGRLYSCRELLHQKCKKLPAMVMRVGVNQSVASFSLFIGLLERHLKIPAKQRTNISAMSAKLFLIEPGSWWLSNPYKQQFFTIALRSALSFKDKNAVKHIENKVKNTYDTLIKHLYEQSYFKHTPKAVEEFLNGGVTKASRNYHRQLKLERRYEAHLYGWYKHNRYYQ